MNKSPGADEASVAMSGAILAGLVVLVLAVGGIALILRYQHAVREAFKHHRVQEEQAK